MGEASSVRAGLLGFESPAYRLTPNPPVDGGPGTGFRLQEYDAGRTGGNLPGGQNSGQWQHINPATGMPLLQNFVSPTGTYATYALVHPSFGGGSFGARTGDGFLALRNGGFGGPSGNQADKDIGGPTVHQTRYFFDSIDFNGQNPGSFVNDLAATWTIYAAAQTAFGSQYGVGANPFAAYLAFYDTAGNHLVDIGWDDNLNYIFRTTTSGAFTTLGGPLAPAFQYDQFTFGFNFQTDTVTFQVADEFGQPKTTLLNNIALGSNGLNLGYVDFVLDSDQFKVAFDDSSFQIAAVPEPSSLVLLTIGAAGLGGAAWKRRRKQHA